MWITEHYRKIEFMLKYFPCHGNFTSFLLLCLSADKLWNMWLDNLRTNAQTHHQFWSCLAWLRLTSRGFHRNHIHWPDLPESPASELGHCLYMLSNVVWWILVSEGPSISHTKLNFLNKKTSSKALCLHTFDASTWLQSLQIPHGWLPHRWGVSGQSLAFVLINLLFRLPLEL